MLSQSSKTLLGAAEEADDRQFARRRNKQDARSRIIFDFQIEMLLKEVDYSLGPSLLVLKSSKSRLGNRTHKGQAGRI
jgi:hypothetical protein